MLQVVDRFLCDVLLLRPESSVDALDPTLVFDNRDLAAIGILAPFVQNNHSHSEANVLRGLHYQIQHAQGKLIRVLSGEIFDVVVDLRRSSASFGQSAAFNMSAANGLLCWVPPGFAHGFYVLSASADVIYSVTDYRYPESERTLLWSDPTLGIQWPLNGMTPILSGKDKCGTPFNSAEYFE